MSAAIRIVLVDTSHPGNIGASARAMKNMGLESLVLVRPQAYPDAEATARASGAADVLSRARVCASVDDPPCPGYVRMVRPADPTTNLPFPTPGSPA